MNRLNQYQKRHNILESIVYVNPNVIKKESEITEKNSELLDIIYGSDSVSGLPKGDLAMFLSDKTNPQLRQFIESQLMNENVVDVNKLSLSQDILNKFRGVVTDDDIARFSRNHDESIEEYAARMSNELEEMRYQRWKKSHEESIRKRISQLVKRENR